MAALKYGVYRKLCEVKRVRNNRTRWRVHLPEALREALGWQGGDSLYLVQKGRWLMVRKKDKTPTTPTLTSSLEGAGESDDD